MNAQDVFNYITELQNEIERYKQITERALKCAETLGPLLEENERLRAALERKGKTK